MVFKGLLVVVSGFLFIFASGVPMRLIARFRPDYKREGILWGIAIWVNAFFASTMVQYFVRSFLYGGDNLSQFANPIPFIIGSILTIFLTQIGMLFFLKKKTLIVKILAWIFLLPVTLFLFIFHKDDDNEDKVSAGLAMGFGIGMIAQVFTGMILITAGAGILLQGFGVVLPFGNIQAATLELVSNESLFGLIAALLSLILFRVALLTISAAQGFLVAGSLLGKKLNFWFALLGYSAFTWIIFILQMLMGEENPGQVSLGLTSPITSVVSAAYYLVAFVLVYRWLSKELNTANKKVIKARSK